MAKYNDVTTGHMEACINRMGGMQNFLRFIGGQGEIVFKTILTFVTTMKIAGQARFVSSDHFKVDTSRNASPKIYYTGDNFKKWFGDKIEEPVDDAELAISRLKEDSRDDRIRAELGDKRLTMLSQFYAAIKAQGNGESGPLLVSGYANIFYIIDKDGEERAVHAVWGGASDGWYVNAYEVDNPDTWVAGSRVVSRK
jgi:hypothetical protein